MGLLHFPFSQIRKQDLPIGKIKNSSDRNSKQQAAHSECLAQSYDGQKDHQSGYTERIPEESGLDDIAITNLKDQGNDKKQECKERIYQQDHDHCYKSYKSKKRTKPIGRVSDF